MNAWEVNFDGLVGLTHHYAGLSFGNEASTRHRFQVSNPRQAAKQGLLKMKALADAGFPQAVIPPHERPFIPVLRQLGFSGSDEQVLEKVARQAPHWLSSVSSASPMWVANAATIAPSADTLDGKVHLTVANLKRIILEDNLVPDPEDADSIILFGNAGKAIRARTANQRNLVELARTNDLVFATGPAGSGKTYTAIALAVKALRNREIKRIVLSRPAVEAGESLGFLPGDMKEKVDPYLQPLYDALADMIPPKKLEEYLETEIIQIAPLAYMRGRTLNDSFVILDEAQNTTRNQLKMFLTRMGTSAKFVVTGDMSQIDLPQRSDSGLIHAFHILKGIKGIAFVQFDAGDIVRHRLVKEIVNAYAQAEEHNNKTK